MSTSPCGSFAAGNALDPFKHVNYNLGMVLGVDDLCQDFTFQYGRNRWIARSAIGYGTLSGLRVTLDRTGGGERGARVMVSSGIAITPVGDLVCVRPTQCAYINEWLASHRQQLGAIPTNNLLHLYLTLAHATRLVDPVAIPGVPCRSQDEVVKPSRIADCFQLELSLTPPNQLEEEIVRGFAAWLNLTLGQGTPPASLAQFEAELRAAFGVADAASPPSSPLDSMLPLPWDNPESPLGSPLSSPPTLPIEQAKEFLEAALRIWITEIRPRCHALGLPGGDCCNENVDPQLEFESQLLLAEIDVPVTPPAGPSPYRLDSARLAELAADERRRPLVVHLRLQQELMLTGSIWMR